MVRCRESEPRAATNAENRLKLRLTVDGKVHEVEVEILEEDRPQFGRAAAASRSLSDAPVAAPVEASPPQAPAPSAPPADERKTFRSPISGVVVKAPVRVGQTVQANDILMVLEAMKMETVLTAPSEGTISKIHAGVGDSVQVKQALVEFE